MLVSLLVKMLHILVLCRVLLIAGVQTLTIDSQLGTSVEDCFERNSIGEHLPSDAIYRNVSELTNRECEQICKQDKQCQAYDYGVGAKGNATCNLSTMDEKTIIEQNPLKRHPDYDVYIRRFQCEQSPPTPIQPLSDDPGPGPQHRPVFRPVVDERPPSEDYLISGDLGYGKPDSSYRPDDAANNKPDYDVPPSYGDHRPQDIPYKPSRPQDSYKPERPVNDPYRPERPNDPYRPERPNNPYRPNDPYRPERPHSPPYGPERPHSPPYGPERPHHPPYGPERPHDPPYGFERPHDTYKPHDSQRPDRPESNDVLQFQDMGKPRPPADEHSRPDPYKPEKPDYHYIIRPNRKPRPPDDYPSLSKPDSYYAGHLSGPIGPPDRPYRPNRPYDKPIYSYHGQYASNYGQNSQNENYLHVEIHDPPRPYIPIKDRPNQQYNGEGYLGYGTYSSQNSYSQSQNSQYSSSVSDIGGYGQGNIPYDRPQKPGYKPGNDRPEKPGYGSPNDDGYGQNYDSYERPHESQGSYGGNQGSYGGNQGTYENNQASYNNHLGSHSSIKGSHSQNDYGNQGSYSGHRPTNSNHGDTGYGLQTQRPHDYNKPSYGSDQGSYNSQNSNKGSYSSSYNEQNSHQASYGSHASYETHRPAYESDQNGYGQPDYQKPQKPTNSYKKPYGDNQDPYGSNHGGYGGNHGTHSSTQSSYGGSQSHHGSSSSSYQGNQSGYGSSASYGNDQKPSHGSYGGQSSYGTTQSAYGSGQGAYESTQGYGSNQGSHGGFGGSYGSSQGGYGTSGSSSSHGSSQSHSESQFADHSTYGGYGNRPTHNQRPGYGNNKPDYSNRPDYDYERPSYGSQRPEYNDEKPAYGSQSTGYGQKPNYNSQTAGYNDPKPGYNDPKPGYNDPRPSYNDPRPGYNDPKPGYNDPKPGYNDPKPGYNDPKPGYNDPKPSYGGTSYDNDTDYRPDVKPVYEYEMDKPNNVPAYIAGPGGEVVTSRPVVIGDYGDRPVYKEPGASGKDMSYKACFRRVLAGQRALRSFVRKVVPCERLEDCRRECALEKRFHCESFNYRLDPSFRGKGLCELMTKPIEAFDLHRDFVQDKDYDFYEVDRNSLEPNCPQTLRGPGLLHSGFLASKDRPTKLDDRNRPNRLDDRNRPNKLDGWRDRNEWVGDRNGFDGRFKEGNRRYEDLVFVPYQIGLTRDNDQENWGQYGGIYGGAQYYKNRNDYHKSINHWGLTSERPSYGVRPFYSYKDEHKTFDTSKDIQFDYHSLGKDDRNFDYHTLGKDDRNLDYHTLGKDDRNFNHHSLGNDYRNFNYHTLNKDDRNFDYHGNDEHRITFDHHGKDRQTFDYHKDDNSKKFDYHPSVEDDHDDFDYHSLYHGREYYSSGEDYYGVAKTQHRYGYGEWKKGRWNTSGVSNGLDFEDDHSNTHYEPADRSDEAGGKDCYSRRRPGMSLSTGAIRRSLIARNVVACETACFGEKEFKCVSYSYRYSNSRGSDNCFLSERPFHGLDLSTDSGSDVYGMPLDQGCSTISHTPWIESECFFHVRSDTAVTGSAAKSSLTVAGLGACEAECIRAQGFFCRGFSFRFDSPTIGDELHNCILTSSPTTSLSEGAVRRAGGHELYARGNYGRGCEPHAQDVQDNGECYLQYEKAAKLTPSAIRGQARVKDEKSCSSICTDAPFKCLSFSYNNNAPPGKDNCLLSEIRLFDLKRGVDYEHSDDDWLFAFDLFNSQCWRPIHNEETSPEIPHPIIHTSSEEDIYSSSGHDHYSPDHSGPPSGPPFGPPPGPPSGPPPDTSFLPGSGPPSGPGYHSYEETDYKPHYNPSDKPYPGPYKPVEPSYPILKPGSYPNEPSLKPGFKPEPGYRPEPDIYKPPGPSFRPPEREGYKPFRPEPRPDYRPPRPGFKPPEPHLVKPVDTGFRPGSSGPGFTPGYGDKPGYLPENKRPEYGPPRPGSQGDKEGGPLEVSWRHYTVSGFPCRAGTICAQNFIVGHWACEPEGGEIGSWDYCCAPSHRCGYSEGFHKPWCYVGPKEDQWRPCSEKYYPYHQHNVPHPSSQGHREDARPQTRPWRGTPNKPDYIPHWDKPPGPYLSPADKQYWDDLYENGPRAYYDKNGNPLPGYSRVPTENRPRIKNRYNPAQPGSGTWLPVAYEDPSGVPGSLGAPRYWPVAYLHKDPPPNMTYFRYNETKQTTTTEKMERTTTPLPVSKEVPPESRTMEKPNDLDAKSSRDDKKINISNTDEVFSVDLDNDTVANNTTEIIPVQSVNISEVEAMKTESYKELDRIDGIDDKLDDFSKSIEVLDIEDAKDDKLSNFKTLEAEERQIEAIGRLLASRRGTKLVIEKRSQKDLESKNIAIDKDLVDFNFGNRFPTSERRAERRGVIKRISKDEIERDRNMDRSLEVSETTFVRPPRVLSTTENIRKAIVNGKVFYDATIREERDLFPNSTRKPKNLRREDVSPFITNNSFREQRDLYLNSTRKPKHLRRDESTTIVNKIRDFVQNNTRKTSLRPIDDLSVLNTKNLREERDTKQNSTRILKTRDELVAFAGNLKDHKEIYLNSTRRSKSLKRLEDTSTPSVIANNNFGRRKILQPRNVNPVRRVRRVYRKRYNPEEVRKRLLERDRNKNISEFSRNV